MKTVTSSNHYLSGTIFSENGGEIKLSQDSVENWPKKYKRYSQYFIPEFAGPYGFKT